MSTRLCQIIFLNKEILVPPKCSCCNNKIDEMELAEYEKKINSGNVHHVVIFFSLSDQSRLF